MKKVALLLVLLIAPWTANAEWVGGVGYFNISDSEGSLDISVGAIAGSIGYRIESEGSFSFMPEFRIGFGVSDDTILGVKVELDRVMALTLRGQYDFEGGAYLFAAPSYANLKVSANSGGMSVSDDDWEFGVGGGFGYRFSEAAMGEISYETYDGTDVIGIALKFSF